MSLFDSIWKDLKYGFNTGNMVQRLILINIAVFVLVQLIHLVVNVSRSGDLIFTDVLYLFCIPADWRELLIHIWTPVTSIFLHEGFFHLLGNMIWLSLFGSIIGDLIGDRRVLPIYLMGGLAGGFVYFLSANLLDGIGSHALGASAAVMAFGGAALILNPEYRVNLLLLGPIKIKYIVLIMVLLDLVGVTGLANGGGHAAHLGGFLFGVLFVYALRDGRDWSVPVNNFFNWFISLFSGMKSKPVQKRNPMRVTHVRPATPPAHAGKPPAKEDQITHQEKLDLILDKIKQQGFENLTAEEKEFLYEASRK